MESFRINPDLGSERRVYDDAIFTQRGTLIALFSYARSTPRNRKLSAKSAPLRQTLSQESRK